MLRTNVVVGIRFVFDDENYYQVLNIPFSYDVDQEEVESHYLKLYSAIVKESNSMNTDSAFYDNYLAMLNSAKKCLSDNLLRAEHFLKLNNRIPTATNNEEFLKIIFDLRNSSDIESRNYKIKEILNEYQTAMKKQFADNDLDSACDTLSKVKFLMSNYD